MRKLFFVATLGIASLVNVSAKNLCNVKNLKSNNDFSNSISLEKNNFEKSESFIKFLKDNKISNSELQESKKTIVNSQKLNATVYSYKINENAVVLVAVTGNNSFGYSFVTKDDIIISNKDFSSVSFSKDFAPYNEAVPTLKCIRETVKKMKQIVEADDLAGGLCDLSPNCNAYLYAVAAAHCAATNNQPPK